MSNALARSLRPAIWMILLAAFLDMMAMGIVMPVLPGLIGTDLSGTGIRLSGVLRESC